MKKTLTWITWLSLSVVSPVALAIGLGQASVSSYLNAPLNVNIPLLESGEYAIEDIRISIADSSDFAAAGLEWSPVAASVGAQIVEHQGRRQVHLSSGQAIQDPWLDLLLSVEFPGGQQFRDVTLLFDPQGYSQSQVRAQNTAPSALSIPSNAAAPPITQPRSTAPSSVYVGSGDTLWGVAERVKSAGVSVQQMMVALLEANPSAFPSGNIHAMRSGQTLNVPDTERVMARSNAEVGATIQTMNEMWRARRNSELLPVPLPDAEITPVTDVAIAAGSAEANAPAAIEAESAGKSNENGQEDQQEPQPEALTRTELTEQLRLSQATLQQVLEERELMRAELDQLRGEVASLITSQRDALASQERSLMPQAASMSETDSQGISGLIARYQWPLTLSAIVLLVALLVWLRKRREETWETASFTDPIVRPTASPYITSGPAVNRGQVQAAEVEVKKAEAKQVEATEVEEEKTDAVKVPIPRAQADEREGQKTPAADENSGHRFVDYHPPSLNSASNNHAELRTETPMQPTVEFASEPLSLAKQSRRPIEEEWEIEEVAFKPRGLDNSDPSKSSK
ncbi:FimV/HubP family polar landmark protein [Halomonas sp. SpR8]|uniref:type IV pilus assembly protein FimV n=1 Tax=Halomonas sp. SpR8 TaxID=3050463 RepID=UPI0027E3C492|nr:FimV/HubP family polar landmark protein [Halomonas sp. SpR8]MDQ7729962.1 FimV/HubP family polar landmark protein [Halomonas sp. SpR8]